MLRSLAGGLTAAGEGPRGDWTQSVFPVDIGVQSRGREAMFRVSDLCCSVIHCQAQADAQPCD